jgi:hypothetical protein
LNEIPATTKDPGADDTAEDLEKLEKERQAAQDIIDAGTKVPHL